jgi:hypothetical protein
VAEAFLERFRLTEAEQATLRVGDIDELFFDALKHVGQIYSECPVLLRTHQKAGYPLALSSTPPSLLSRVPTRLPFLHWVHLTLSSERFLWLSNISYVWGTPQLRSDGGNVDGAAVRLRSSVQVGKGRVCHLER